MYTSPGTFVLLLLNLTNRLSQMLCYSGSEVIEHQSNVHKVENFTLVHRAHMVTAALFHTWCFITNFNTHNLGITIPVKSITVYILQRITGQSFQLHGENVFPSAFVLFIIKKKRDCFQKLVETKTKLKYYRWFDLNSTNTSRWTVIVFCLWNF